METFENDLQQSSQVDAKAKIKKEPTSEQTHPQVERVDSLSRSQGWKVKEKFSAKASFYVPLEDGTGWNVTAGGNGGGKAIIEVHQKEGEKDVSLVRWLNYIGKDGLNCRIIHLLPIERNKGETKIFFKGASTTTSGIRRKTIFALKFETLEDAGEFEMWWLYLSGKIALWKKRELSSNTGNKADILETHDLKSVAISKNNNIVDPRESTLLGKRKYWESMLKSPPADYGINFTFDNVYSRGIKYSPRKARKMETEAVTSAREKISPEIAPSNDIPSSKGLAPSVSTTICSDDPSPEKDHSLDNSREDEDSGVLVDCGPVVKSQQIYFLM